MKNTKRKLSVVFLIMAFAIFNVLSFIPNATADEIEDLQDDISKLEKKADKTEDEINDLNKKKAILATQLGTTKGLIVKTKTEISKKEGEIANLEKKIEMNKKILGEYLRNMYYSETELPLMQVISSEGRSLDNLSQLLNTKEKILSVLNEVNQDKEELEGRKKELDEKKEDHEKLLSIQQSEQVKIQSNIKMAEASLAELNSKINKLKGELSGLLGKEVSFKNILDAASFAAKVTGIRRDYLLGVLVVESNLGRFTGGCTADKSNMSSYRLGIFKDICEELDYNWKKQKVSCPPRSYKGSGGAMGVAQFMSDTWLGYKSSIASATGHNPPDPWNLTDGVVAMALKLTKVDGVKQHKESAEAKAYCIYLAGGNWAAYCDNKGTNYGDLVLYWADNYEKKL